MTPSRNPRPRSIDHCPLSYANDPLGKATRSAIGVALPAGGMRVSRVEPGGDLAYDNPFPFTLCNLNPNDYAARKQKQL
jgi:hypothetical protein